MAHSMGNFVIWDAIRLNDLIHPGVPFVNNVTSIEAAVWEEAFTPEQPTQPMPTRFIESSTWIGYFYTPDTPIRSGITGNVINSYYAADSALALMVSAGAVADLNESTTNPNGLPRTGSTLEFLGPESAVPLGTVPNPIANVNVDASQYGWDSSVSSHSAYRDDPYPEIWDWWYKVFAGGGVPTNAAVALGNQKD